MDDHQPKQEENEPAEEPPAVRTQIAPQRPHSAVLGDLINQGL